MEALDAIMTRRSIRKYTAEPVSEEDIKTILKAGMQAPSAMNERPWHFIVVDDRKILGDITRVHPYSQMLKEAPAAIIVCGDTSKGMAANVATGTAWWHIDCAAASQNILLAAHSLGLGSVWVGVYPNMERVKAIKEIFRLPDNIIPFSILPIGHPNEKKPKEDRYDKARVHRNKW